MTDRDRQHGDGGHGGYGLLGSDSPSSVPENGRRDIGWFRRAGATVTALFRRPPDFVITRGDGTVYLRRWFIIPRNGWFNIYLHQILASDDDRALHDHPWVNCSIVLAGRYIEVMPETARVRRAGSVTFRRPTARHRLYLGDGETAWSLFLTGPKVRVWGFQCPNGWVPWYDFVDPDNPGSKGPGCDAESAKLGLDAAIGRDLHKSVARQWGGRSPEIVGDVTRAHDEAGPDVVVEPGEPLRRARKPRRSGRR